MKFKVTRTKGKPIVVAAEYYKQEPNGSLVFRNHAVAAIGYPTTVATIAAGQWVAVLTDGEVE
jgi:hypothetical protein